MAIVSVLSLCQQYLADVKLVFVPNARTGRALEDAVARKGGGWAALTCTAPAAYAKALVWPLLQAKDYRLLSAGTAATLAIEAVDAIPGEHKRLLLVGNNEALTVHAGAELARVFNALRLEGIPPSNYQQGARTSREQAQAAAYSEFVRLLVTRQFADDAVLLEKATIYITDGTLTVDGYAVAVLDEVETPRRVQMLLEALQTHAAAFYRIGTPEPQNVPVGFAGRTFGDAPVVPATNGSHANGQGPQVKATAAVGAAEEVRAVWRTILQKGLALDAVEIACSDVERYLPLIEGEAARIRNEKHKDGLPLSFSTGRYLRQTRAAQALRGWLTWVREGYDVKQLIVMLRAGLLRLGHEGRPSGWWSEATLLASRRYETGRAGCAKQIARIIQSLESREASTDEGSYKLDRWRFVQQRVAALLSLLPGGSKSTLPEVAEAARQMLVQFGPRIQRAERGGEATLEETAYNHLLTLLSELKQSKIHKPMSVRQLADLVEHAVDTAKVGAEGPKPGKAYVVPLKEADFSGRKHLFVLGLDDRSVQTVTRPPRPAVSTSVAKQLKAAGYAAPSLTPTAEASDWQVQQAIDRHPGTTHLHCRTYDLLEGEPCFASPQFLRWGRAAALEALKTPAGPMRFAGQMPDERLTLNPSEDWLATYVASGGRPLSTEALRAAYPLMADGLKAMRQRASDEWTPWDGLLATDTNALALLDSDTVFSPSRIERFAKAPYLYFVQYVLRAKALDEPALNDHAWLDPAQRGTLLHDTFERFLKAVPDDSFSAANEDRLMETLEDRIAEETQTLAPPNPYVKRAERHRLAADARTFFLADPSRETGAAPCAFEYTFGYAEDGTPDPLRLAVGNWHLKLRGKIDRLDKASSGAYHVWDYKTGGSSGFQESDGLQNGATLQWMLYTMVVEQTHGRVTKAGYFFTSEHQGGRLIAFNPHAEDQSVKKDAPTYTTRALDLLTQLSTMAEEGSFPMNPEAKDWNYGYELIRLDAEEETRRVKRKVDQWPEDRQPYVADKISQKV
jgi:hypothetical protein